MALWVSTCSDWSPLRRRQRKASLSYLSVSVSSHWSSIPACVHNLTGILPNIPASPLAHMWFPMPTVRLGRGLVSKFCRQILSTQPSIYIYIYPTATSTLHLQIREEVHCTAQQAFAWRNAIHPTIADAHGPVYQACHTICQHIGRIQTALELLQFQSRGPNVNILQKLTWTWSFPPLIFCSWDLHVSMAWWSRGTCSACLRNHAGQAVEVLLSRTPVMRESAIITTSHTVLW